MSARGRMVSFGALALLVALVLGAVLLRWAALRYVQGDDFRRLVGRQVGRSLKAEADFSTFHAEGSDLASGGFKAQGLPASFFSRLEADQLRAQISFGRLTEGVWQVDRVEAEQARLDLSGPRLPGVVSPKVTAENQTTGGTPWWPHQVEIKAAGVQQAELHWDGGTVRGVRLEAERQGRDWLLHGEGGSMAAEGWPPLDLRTFRLRQRGEALLLEEAQLQHNPAGSLKLTGEIHPGESLSLEAHLDRMPLEPLLTPDWRVRLNGNLNGTVNVRSALPLAGAPVLSGSLTLTEGRLEALPVLDELATFTQLAQFRRLNLSRVEGDFERTSDHLRISRLVAESPGLLRVEGGFTVIAGQLEGDFQIGLTPASVQWLPGARSRVFTITRDGYSWAPLHLGGPVESPHEDLTGRLAAAVAAEGVDTVRKATEVLPAPLQDAAKRALDLFLK